jgi:ribosomal-protein-alanine N-acetyltransferase
MQEHRIRTARMELIAASAMLLRSELMSRDHLSALLNAVVGDGWPPEIWELASDEFLARMENHPGLAGWLNWYWVLVEGDSRTLIGSGGFTGAPFNGEVMVGYTVLTPYRHLGYGSEAVSALINWAFARPGVQRIVAETGHENEASIRLLERCGLEYAGKGFERGTIRYVIPKEKWLLFIK